MKISCICVTENRPELLAKAIAHYDRQSYSDKELLMVYLAKDSATDEFAKSQKQDTHIQLVSTDEGWKPVVIRQGDSDHTFIKVDTNEILSLGEKRNIALEQADGEYLCIWDDDDWYHKDRLTRQMEFLQFVGKPAVALSSLSLYLSEMDKAYVTNPREEGWEGSLLSHRDAIGQYADLNTAEDTPVLIRLYRENKLAIMDDPSLYIYYIHSTNTSSAEHFQKLARISTEMDPRSTERVRDQLEIPTDPVKTYDAVLSLGAWCQVGAACRMRDLNIINSPLHNFGVKTWQNVMDILESRFEDYWELENMAIGKPEDHYSARYEELRSIYKVYCNKYNMLSNHHFDVSDNTPEELVTYEQFKGKMELLSEVFLEQCRQLESVLFVCKIMSAPEKTTITQEELRRFCKVLSELREGKPYELRISVPEEYYEQVCQWVEEDGFHFVKVFQWTIPFNDEYFSEEWNNMFENVRLAPDYLYRLNKDVFQIEDPESQHIAYLNS